MSLQKKRQHPLCTEEIEHSDSIDVLFAEVQFGKVIKTTVIKQVQPTAW